MSPNETDRPRKRSAHAQHLCQIRRVICVKYQTDRPVMKYGSDALQYKSPQRAQTSAKLRHKSHIARIPDSESQHGDPDHPKNLINCSLYHYRAIMKTASNSAHNWWSNGRISD